MRILTNSSECALSITHSIAGRGYHEKEEANVTESFTLQNLCEQERQESHGPTV